MTKTLTCVICDKPYTTARYRGQNRRFTCSDECNYIRSKYVSGAYSRKLATENHSIGSECLCQNFFCKNKFTKTKHQQYFCSAECRKAYKKIFTIKDYKQTPSKKGIPKSLNEISKLMNDMGYGNKYGLFCREHPELL